MSTKYTFYVLTQESEVEPELESLILCLKLYTVLPVHFELFVASLSIHLEALPRVE